MALPSCQTLSGGAEDGLDHGGDEGLVADIFMALPSGLCKVGLC